MLTSENEQLEVITSNRIAGFQLENSIALLSACDTAAGHTTRSDLYFTGFVKAFADAGSKFITASLWPVQSTLAKEASVSFLNEFNDGSILSAVARVSPEPFQYGQAPFVYIYP